MLWNCIIFWFWLRSSLICVSNKYANQLMKAGCQWMSSTHVLLILVVFFFIFQDIPPVNVFGPGSYVKRGFLMKLEMSSQPLGQRKWRRRFCILTLDKMFLYEDEKSRGYEKHSEVIQLSNFQRCQRSSFSKNGGYFEFSLLDEERRQNSRKTTHRFFHHVTSSVSIFCPQIFEFVTSNLAWFHNNRRENRAIANAILFQIDARDKLRFS